MRLSRIIFFFLFAMVFAGKTYAANLLVPYFELITRGDFANYALTLNTYGNIDLFIDGGYKFGGRLLFNLEGTDLQDPNADIYLKFKSASVIIRDIFETPFNLKSFTGIDDNLATGTLFPELFATKQITSRYSGYFYFPDSTRYNGIHTIAGTGVSLEAASDSLFTSLSLYQDGYLGAGRFSTDYRILANTTQVKLEGFFGASFPVSVAGYYRFGFMFFYDTGKDTEFYTQIGIPKWDPVLDEFNIDLFYFLFEPRVHFGYLSILLTFFWHPRFYLQAETNELDSKDLNINFLIGKPEEHPFYGGFETGFSFRTGQADFFKTVVSPYVSAASSGVVWNFKINFNVFPFNLANLGEIFIGVNAEF